MISFTSLINRLSIITRMTIRSHIPTVTVAQTLQQDCLSVLLWFKDNQMKANPDKFQAISFGKKGNQQITDFTLGNTNIQCEDSVVLLGIEIDHLLTFNNHITEICKKSARQLAVLKRLGHLLTIKGKLAIFHSFIASNFNYCPLIWHFCSQSNTNKLENIQKRALRFIYNNYTSSHADLLRIAGTDYLHTDRTKYMACEVYKIVNKMSPLFIQDLIALKHTQYSTRQENSAVVPPARTTKYGLK